jgi:hypothetical protein
MARDPVTCSARTGPTARGLAKPRDFLRDLRAFSDGDVRKIMSENARALTFT